MLSAEVLTIPARVHLPYSLTGKQDASLVSPPWYPRNSAPAPWIVIV
jgi:hypothetical protein